MLRIYLELLRKKWYFLIGVFLFATGKIFNVSISNDILYIILFVSFVYSSYLVWKDEYNGKLNILQSKKYLNDISEISIKIKKLYKKSLTSEYDEELEKQVNLLLSDLNIVYASDFLDKYQLNIIELEINSLVKIMKDNAYNESEKYDIPSGTSSFENDEEVQKKYLDYAEQIGGIIKTN